MPFEPFRSRLPACPRPLPDRSRAPVTPEEDRSIFLSPHSRLLATTCWLTCRSRNNPQQLPALRLRIAEASIARTIRFHCPAQIRLWLPLPRLILSRRPLLAHR